MNALDIIRQQGVVAIVREPTTERAATAVTALVDAGIRAIEVSLVTPGALDVVRHFAAAAPAGVAIGVGTVLREEDVQAAADAGARFLVAPGHDPAVIAAAIGSGMDILPGVATPSEAIAAVKWGATAVKVFPASLWTPNALRDLRTALPWLETVPTGGVTLDSAAAWIRAGAIAVGIGSALTTSPTPQSTAQRLLETIQDARAAP